MTRIVKASRGKYLVLPFLLCILFVSWATPAFSLTITFGDGNTFSNVPSIDTDLTDFTLSLAVTAPDQLRVELVNNSALNEGFDGYLVRRYSFNTNIPDPLDDKGKPKGDLLTLTNSNTNWDNIAYDHNVNGTGRFDISVKDGGTDLDPGSEVYWWEFQINTLGTWDGTNFCLPNDEGYLAAIHAVPVTTNPDGSTVTGHVGVVVPETASLLLLGTGVVGLLGLRRKMKN